MNIGHKYFSRDYNSGALTNDCKFENLKIFKGEGNISLSEQTRAHLTAC